jgi:transcriptional regulator with XRE-family HTH domain
VALSPSEGAPESPAARVGPRLRALRKARNLTIAQVADAAGLTKGFVSRLERDQTSVSLAALFRLCDVLHAPVGGLFEAPSTALVRAGTAPVVDFGAGLRHAHQSPATVHDLRAVMVLLAPSGTAGREEYAIHGGTLFVHVLKGALELELETDRFVLNAGDSLTFPGRTHHTYRNTSRHERCEALWVVAPAM